MIATIIKYRILFYALAISLVLGSWEVLQLQYLKKDSQGFSQQIEQRNMYQLPERSLSHTLNLLYPEFADSIFLRGVATGFQNRNFLTGCQLYDQAAATGVKHNEELFQKITVCLERSNADDETIQLAVDRWRKNFPGSRQFPYFMSFRGFQGTGRPEQAAQRALESIPYVQYLGIQYVGLANEQTGEVMFRLAGSEVKIRAIRDCLEQAGFISHR